MYVVQWGGRFVCPFTVGCLKLVAGRGLIGGLLVIGVGAVGTLLFVGSGGWFDVDSLFANTQVNSGPFWCWAAL